MPQEWNLLALVFRAERQIRSGKYDFERHMIAAAMIQRAINKNP
jgi:hypothetical protein